MTPENTTTTYEEVTGAEAIALHEKGEELAFSFHADGWDETKLGEFGAHQFLALNSLGTRYGVMRFAKVIKSPTPDGPGGNGQRDLIEIIKEHEL